MDVTQFLAQVPMGGLLLLMAIPLLIAVVLVAYMVIVYTRRQKKSQMKHGAAIPLKIDAQAPQALPQNSETAPQEAAEELNLDILDKPAREEKSMTHSRQFEHDPQPADNSARLNAAPTPRPAEPVELLRLLREPQSGQLIVEVAGERYSRLADISDGKIGQFVLKVAAHLLAFTNGVIVTEAGMKTVYTPKNLGAAPPPPLASGAAAAIAGIQPATAPPEIEAAFLESLKSGKISPQTEPSQTIGRLGLRQPATPKPKSSALNLAEEINEIVQFRLQASPLAHTTRIDIADEPGGGIRITVNEQSYTSPDDIPAGPARDLIKASIKEWERT